MGPQKLSDGLFLDCCREVSGQGTCMGGALLTFTVALQVAKNFPELQYEEKSIDLACLMLVQNPKDLDVMVCQPPVTFCWLRLHDVLV